MGYYAYMVANRELLDDGVVRCLHVVGTGELWRGMAAASEGVSL